MGRPRGEISQVLEQALRERGRGTSVELAHATQVGRAAAKQAMRDMLNAGRAKVVDTVTHAGCNRPMNVYAPCEPGEASADPHAALAEAMRLFATPGRAAEGSA